MLEKFVASFLHIKTLKWHANLMKYLWLDVAFAWSEETICEGWTPKTDCWMARRGDKKAEERW